MHEAVEEEIQELTDEPTEEMAAGTPLHAETEADDEAELGCTVEGGLVRL